MIIWNKPRMVDWNRGPSWTFQPLATREKPEHHPMGDNHRKSVRQYLADFTIHGDDLKTTNNAITKDNAKKKATFMTLQNENYANLSWLRRNRKLSRQTSKKLLAHGTFHWGYFLTLFQDATSSLFNNPDPCKKEKIFSAGSSHTYS